MERARAWRRSGRRCALAGGAATRALAGGLGAPLALTGGPHGEIVIAGARSPDPAAGEQLIQGTAGGRLATLAAVHSTQAPAALTTAYLGDVAALSPVPARRGASALQLYVERYFAQRLAPRDPATPTGGGPLTALTVALDYRSDAVAVWAAGDSIYARELPARGAPHPTQRLAPAGSHVALAALLSDDDRSIVAWSEQRGGQTSVYIDHVARRRALRRAEAARALHGSRRRDGPEQIAAARAAEL